MRISYSIMLIVAAASQINAAATPYSASKCILTSSNGAGQGNGFKNYCCETQADCIDDCVNGVCVGPSAPSSSCDPASYGLGLGDGYKGDCCADADDCRDDCVKGACNGPVNTKTATATKTTTAVATPTVAPGTCTPGSIGLGKGDGYKGACCEDQSDCKDDCIKGVCNGPVNTKTTTVAATTTTVPPTPTDAPGTCTPGSIGLGKGDGYKGACCEDQSDCKDDCIKGVCNGPVNTKTTKTTTVTKTTTAAATPTVAPGTCTPGSIGLGKGDGYKGACCEDQSDCKDDCIKGVCNGPVNTKTTKTTTVTKTTTAAATPTVAPGTCTPGSIGLGKGDGYKGACCEDQSDCRDDCIKGVCNGPVNTKTATVTKTTTKAPAPTPDACKSGFFGKKNGKGGDNACCKTSDDCKESCLKGRCGLA
ncbi:hypothetical protein INT47_002039 [Mucor saturninus]|uniref:Uncharacterized protein n=1 Tax=Mucor saturninus TaxID=64648 RepID=A0A8H7QZP3_9FUNG|nr:hypothetical protein INT47_002039 [Mucor saturninus]